LHVAGSCLYKLRMAHGGKELGPLPTAHKELAEETGFVNVSQSARPRCGLALPGRALLRFDRAGRCCILSTWSRLRHRCCRSFMGCHGAAVSHLLQCLRHRPVPVQERVSWEFTMLKVCTRLTDYQGMA